jgi:hypothetical protein
MNIPSTFKELVDAAFDNPDHEMDLRTKQRLALKRIQHPNAAAHPDFKLWKQREDRLWLLVSALNARIDNHRDTVIESVYSDEELLAMIDRSIAAAQ